MDWPQYFENRHRRLDPSKSDGSAFRRTLRHCRLSLAGIALLFVATSAFTESGADTYKARCSACHGKGGAGDTMLGKNLRLRDLRSDEVQKQSDEQLFAIISKGKNRMPAFDRKLSKDQIANLVKHIRSLKK
jgi:cytochrome c6